MNDTALSRLFLRFRDRRDGRALARVFDATAADLLRVAAHLVRDMDEAEDLVQSTFRIAIERADSFEEQGSLRGWLFGILSREAAKTRRKASRRRAGPMQERASAEREPLESMVAEETPDVLGAAVRGLASPYREVVEPSVFEGLSPAQIASRLERAPGTVRVQLQRGLERLRDALPREYAVGAALPFLLHAHQGGGLEALKGAVMREAGVSTAVAKGAVTAKTGFLAGLLATVSVVGGLWLLREPSPPTPDAAASPPVLFRGSIRAESTPYVPPRNESSVAAAPGEALAAGTTLPSIEQRIAAPVEAVAPDAAAGDGLTVEGAELPAEPGRVQVDIARGVDLPMELVILLRDERRVLPNRSMRTEHGSASFEAVEPGPYEVSAVGGWGLSNLVPERIEVEPGSFTRVVLHAGGSALHGSIALSGHRRRWSFTGDRVDPTLELEPQEWLRNLHISVEGPMRGVALVHDDTYRIEGLIPGVYTLSVRLAGALVTYEVPVPDREETRFDLSPLSGRLHGRAPRGAATGEGAVVELRPRDWGVLPDLQIAVQTDDSGSFDIDGIPLGRYTAYYFDPGEAAVRTGLGPGARAPVELTDDRDQIELHWSVPPMARVAGEVEITVDAVVDAAVEGNPEGLDDPDLHAAVESYTDELAKRFSGRIPLYRRSGRGADFTLPAYALEVQRGRFDALVPTGEYLAHIGGMSFAEFDVPHRGNLEAVLELSDVGGGTAQVWMQWGNDRSPPLATWEVEREGVRAPHWLFVSTMMNTGILIAGREVFELPFGDYTFTADFGDGLEVTEQVQVDSEDTTRVGLSWNHEAPR